MDFCEESAIDFNYESLPIERDDAQKVRSELMITPPSMMNTVHSESSIFTHLYDQPGIDQSIQSNQSQSSSSLSEMNKKLNNNESIFFTGSSNPELDQTGSVLFSSNSTIHCLVNQYEGAFGVLSKVYCSLKDSSSLSETQFQSLQQFEELFQRHR